MGSAVLLARKAAQTGSEASSGNGADGTRGSVEKNVETLPQAAQTDCCARTRAGRFIEFGGHSDVVEFLESRGLSRPYFSLDHGESPTTVIAFHPKLSIREAPEH